MVLHFSNRCRCRRYVCLRQSVKYARVVKLWFKSFMVGDRSTIHTVLKYFGDLYRAFKFSQIMYLNI